MTASVLAKTYFTDLFEIAPEVFECHGALNLDSMDAGMLS